MNESLQELSKKLNELDTSQNSIEGCSKDILEMAKTDESRIEDLAKLWKNCCLSKSKQLASLYLVNDIIQNSAFQKLALHEALYPHVVEVFPRVYHTGNNKLKIEIERIVDIWADRKVYPEENLNYLKQMLFTLPNLDNINNPLVIPYLICNNFKIPDKVIDFSKNFENMEKYKEMADAAEKENVGDVGDLKASENKYREGVLRNASELIKSETQIFAKHVAYLQEIDRLLDKISSYKKLNNMQVD
jgi:hypothetical protein